MAMTFMAPMPWEADAFYAQPGMADNGLSLDQWPVGTGPFMMTEFVQRPAPRDEAQPELPRRALSRAKASRGDQGAGLLADCGKRMPFIDTLVRRRSRRRRCRARRSSRQGYLDVPEIERPEWGVDFRDDADDSDEVQAPVRGARASSSR